MKNLLQLCYSSILILFSLGITALGLSSCAQDSYDNTIPNESQPQLIRLTASMEVETNPSTRTALDQDGASILWTVGDKIKVFTDLERNGSLFESTNDKLSRQADFEGPLDIADISSRNKIYAVYPYSVDASFDGTSITTSLASEQVAQAEGFSDHLLPALAVSSDMNLSFYQIATGIRFFISTEGVKKVIFRGNKGESVSGSFKVSMNENGRPEITEVVDGCQWVTLLPPYDGTFQVGKMYYLSVLPHNFEKGFTLTFLTDTKVARFTFNNDVTFRRAIWKNGNNLEESISYTDKYSFTGLPVCEVNVQDNANIESKETWLNCVVRIGEDYYDNLFAEGSIKGRGNSTWVLPKKPYAIKFSQKESLLSLPEGKSWVLLANYYDATLLRNDLAFYIGKELTTQDWTPHFEFVDLMLNGQYKGIYQLGEKINISSKRVNVGDDGFLLEIDKKAEPDEVTFDVLHIPYPVNIKDPEVEAGSEEYNYISNILTQIDEVLFSDDFTDPIDGWQRYMDIDSFVDWYLVQEISKNPDSNFSTSCFMSFKPGGKLKMGPLWDFDIAFCNDQWVNDRPSSTITPDGFYIKSVEWYNRLFCDPVFVERVKERFNDIYANKQNLFDFIDSRAAILIEKVAEDNHLWGTITDKTATVENVKIAYQEKVDFLKSWIDTRLTWLYENINAL